MTTDSYEPKRLLDPTLHAAVQTVAGVDPEVADRLADAAHAVEQGTTTTSSAAAKGFAMASVPVAIAALATTAFAQGNLPGIVVDVLNFALTLEHLEAEFYVRGVGTSGLLPADMREPFDQIRKHEVAHVAFLQGALGGRAIAKPTFDYTAGGAFADVFSNPATFAAVAQAFEDTGVRAYKGQAANLMGEKAILRAALRIHSVEARHAAQVRRMRQQKGWIVGSSRGDLPPQTQGVYQGEANRFHFILAQAGSGESMTESFDETLTKGQVMNIVRPFITGGR